ncbi:hypothetical protein PMAYCL1PPCAC_08062 [Pristionchus mayeri]|uniref:Uncharacterized protein n=1 Tax=Pristionchus mayeri TaxID=1317129 RepID=A0AAN4ZAZ8_9BILA|nr:hypothetical protein PMAYCL1PPCAC_08062 [Pristionchus mayeri]
MLFAPKFVKAYLSAASLIDTAINESFHSLSLMYSPKRFACAPHYYTLKTKVSILHYYGGKSTSEGRVERNAGDAKTGCTPRRCLR